MNPVIGIDVAKGKSEGQALLDKNKPFGKSFSFEHNKTGLQKLWSVVLDVEKECGLKPTIILESTGHYHLPVTRFLEEHEMIFIVLNPLISYKARKSQLRKVKTDAIDARSLADLYYKEEFQPFKQRGIDYLNLRNLTRQHEALTNTYVQNQLVFQSVLDQVFPEYSEVFGDLFSKAALEVLKKYPTPASVLEAGVDQIAQHIALHVHRSKSKKWALDKAHQIVTTAENCPSTHMVLESHLFSLNMLIKLISEIQTLLHSLEAEIDTVGRKLPEYDLLLSVPGFGKKTAATILAEIGEIERFDHPKKLVAFAGIDPSVYQSGQFTASRSSITRRGSKRLRKALYLAAQCALRQPGQQRLREYFTRKKETKPYKVAIIACVNKLLHLIYAILTSGIPYNFERQQVV
jgi:transposase